MRISFETAELAHNKGYSVQTIGDIHGFLYNIKTKKYDDFPYYLLFMTLDEINDDQYGEYILSPTQSELQKWLREKYNLNINIKHRTHSQTYCYDISSNYNDNEISKLYTKFETYEDALEDALMNSLLTINKNE